jgi:hypothetical protein
VHEVELLLPFMKDTYAEGVPGTFFLFQLLTRLFFVMYPLFYIIYFFILNYLFTCCKACSRKDVLGVLVFKGSVCSFAYLNSKEPISQAVTDIKVFNNQLRLYFFILQ